MNIVFMGTPDFAVPCLRKLVEQGYKVVGVVTQPDRPVGRKRTLTPPPVKAEAGRHGIPVLQPEKLRDPDAMKRVISLQPDLIVTAAYGQILPETLLHVPANGCINVHASLLPKYRGGAPIHRSIIEGEKETGVTIMYMVKALDAGDMLSKVAVPIGIEDTVGSLHDKLSEAGSELLIQTLPDLLSGKISGTPQDHEQATYAPNLNREDERIDWSEDSLSIYNRVRGLNPWPVAFTTINGEVMKIWKADVPSLHSKSIEKHSPGTVLEVDPKGIVVATGEGAISLIEIQPAGKKRMSVSDYVRGSAIHNGDRFGA
jgi:methionyl-tRNA formyltransferase